MKKKQTVHFRAIFYFLILLSPKSWTQNCIQSSQYPSGTINIASTGTTNVTPNNWAGEFSINNFTAAGIYSISAVGGSSNYLTVTDNSNNPIGSGYSILGVVIPSVGIYRIHVSTGPGCGTESVSRSVNVWSAPTCTSTTQYPNSTVPINSLGTTTVTTCNWAGDYAVISFSAAGIYTINGAGAGTYYSVKNAAGTIIYASGASPLAVNIPAAGTFYVHMNTGGPPSCGTDATCRVTTVIGPTPIVPPANDLCSAAILLSVPGSTTGTTINATTESPAPGTCGTSYSQPGVWYRVVGNGNQFGADLCTTSGWDSKIFVYTGSCGAWSCVTGNDDFGPVCSSAAASATWCSIPTVTYYILVTGFSSASAFNIALTQTVNSGANPTVAVTAATPSVCLTLSTALTATGAGVYVWANGATTSSIAVTPTATTVYTVYGRAAASCNYDIKTVTVTALANPTVGISSNSGSICPAAVFTTTPNGAATYTFIGSPSGTVIVSSGNASLSPIVNTNYTVYGTGSNGCRSLLANSPTATVITLTSPSLSTAVSSTAICVGQSATITATGANTYTWNGTTISSSITVSPVSTTIYTVSGTGTTICNGVTTRTLVVNQLPTVTVNSGTVCAGLAFTMSPSGANSYVYSNGASTVIPTSNASYTVSGTSTAGCISATGAIAAVTVVALPVVSVNSGTVCSGSPFYIVPSGAVTYTQLGGNNPLTPTISSSYTITGTSSVGCISLPAISNATVFPLPVVSVSLLSASICATSSAILNASGAVTYTWNGTTPGASLMVSPATSTTYFVYGTDALGCSNFTTQPITVNPLPNLSLVNSNTFICQGKTATLTASGSGTYSWTTNDTSAVIAVSPFVTTVYGVTVMNSFGCTRTATTSVTVNTVVLALTANTTICDGDSITLIASGPTSFTWSHTNSPFSSVVVKPIVNTTYSVTGSDPKSCKYGASVTVSVNPTPTLTADATPTICAGESLTLNTAGATSYSWNNGGSGQNNSVTPIFVGANNYTVIGSNAFNCKAMLVLTVMVDKCTGIAEINSGLNLSVYPNPNTGVFVIELNNGFEKQIDISDVTGRIVYSSKSLKDLSSIDLHEYAKGVYYVRITSEEKTAVVRVITE